MIEEGYQSHAKYWGNYTAKSVVRLKEQVHCYSQEKGDVLFNPTIVKLEWDIPPSDDKNDIWFPYWITVGKGSKEKYGQYAPMIGEKALLELLKGAIAKNYFSPDFLQGLRKAIDEKQLMSL
jgi:hypothetical protein